MLKKNEKNRMESKLGREHAQTAKRGQTAVEYLLLIAAMVAFVALITYIIKTQILR